MKPVTKPGRSKYWFKRRRYGYGWTPVTWQGWIITVATLGAVIGSAVVVALNPDSSGAVWLYLIAVVTLIVALIIIAALKGPSPKWRWGNRDGDNPEGDF